MNVADDAKYELTIAYGGKKKVIDDICTTDDVNLGDIAFE